MKWYKNRKFAKLGATFNSFSLSLFNWTWYQRTADNQQRNSIRRNVESFRWNKKKIVKFYQLIDNWLLSRVGANVCKIQHRKTRVSVLCSSFKVKNSSRMLKTELNAWNGILWNVSLNKFSFLPFTSYSLKFSFDEKFFPTSF
jgi:hypothetical protein